MKDNLKYYSITDAQKTIWNTEQFYNKNSISNIVGTSVIHKKVNFRLLELAIKHTVKNNDALRANVILKDNIPMQIFNKYQDFKVKQYQIENEEKLNEFMNNIAKKPLSEENLLIKFIMFKFPKGDGGVGIIINHILSDAWSTTLVASEVMDIYERLLKKEDISDCNKSSYIEYINNETIYRESEKYKSDKKFWEKEYETLPEEVASVVTSTNNNFSTEAIRKEIILDSKLTDEIKRYCRLYNISEYVFLLGVYSIYLSKVSNQKEVIINTPILNRKNIKEKQIVGMFVNALPLKLLLNGEQEILDYFKMIKFKSFDAFKHQKYSIFEILKYIREKHNVNTCIYDFVFSYQNAKGKNISDLPYSLKWYFNGNITENINVHISDLDDLKKIIIYYDYKISSLNEKEIIIIHERILKIINQILKNEKLRISNIQILSDDDILKINEINDTGKLSRTKNNTISYLLNSSVNKFPNNIAVKYKNIEITYKKLDEKINILANILRNKGVKRNTPVALIFDKSIEMIISMFAIIKAGGYYIPILPDEEKERMEYIIKDSNPLLIITDKEYSNITDIPIINIKKEVSILEINENIIEKKNIKDINFENDLLYMIYTSGSTGNPKGTQIMHKNVCGLMKSIKSDANLCPTQDDVSMSLLKYSFDASGIDVYSSLLFGGKLLLIDKENELNPSEVVKIMEKEKVTRSFLIPKWVEEIAKEDLTQNIDLSSLRILGTGGETLKPNTVENLFEKYKKLKIINLYGPTETTMFVTYKVLGDEEFHNNDTTIGKPINFSRILVLNSENNVMPINTKGELVIYEDESSIENIAKGYLNLDEINKTRFREIYNPLTKKKISIYKTGDIVRIDGNLNIHYYGRTDDMVKINGSYLVALNEVENTIYKILNQKYKVCVVAVNNNNNKILVAFIEGAEDEDKEGVTKYINKNITFYMKPKKIIIMNKFPINASGKINRKELKEIAAKELSNLNKTIINPRTQTEKIIYNIIKSHTKIENISIKDDFINDLSIDSLMIATIYSDLAFYKIKLQDIYTYSTIESLSDFISTGAINKAKIYYENVEIKNDSKEFDLKNVLLTGVTGFLGIHVFEKLIFDRKVKKIYCAIRNKEFKTGDERLKERVKYYFKNYKKIENLISKKVKVINADLTEKNFGMENEEYISLQENVTSVINCAANVRHYCKLDDLMKDNVDSVKNILDFCDGKISLAHVSTLSIVGFKGIETEDLVFDENKYYIKQNFDNNPYLISKFMAEKILLENNKTNIKIFRMGNIMPRLSDGKFQFNYEKNAFMNAIRNIVKIRKVPQEILNFKLEFSPVDECANAILKLVTNKSNDKVYHILNNNTINVSELVNMINKKNYLIETVPINEFINDLDSQEEIGKQYIKEYILQNNLNDFSLDNTLKELKIRRFKWSIINKKYINYIIKIIEENRW